MSAQPDLRFTSTPGTGFTLRNGTRIIHGTPARDAFPPDSNIPGRMFHLNGGHVNDSSTPCFCGPTGFFPFSTENRMPRHVHLSTSSTRGEAKHFVMEKIFVPYGVALAELGDGQIYVIPPKTMVLIAPGVPHTWVACPPGLNVTQTLGVQPLESDDGEEVVSEGKFLAFFEYAEPTGFFPTAQTQRLEKEEDYVRCDDWQSIRFPVMNIDDVLEKALFVWGSGTVTIDKK